MQESTGLSRCGGQSIASQIFPEREIPGRGVFRAPSKGADDNGGA